MIMTKPFEVLDRLGNKALIALTTKHISKDYLNHLHIVEKAIRNFNFKLLDEKLKEEDETDFQKPDILEKKAQWKKSWYRNRNILSTGILLGEMHKVTPV